MLDSMGPTKTAEGMASQAKHSDRPRRGSLPELKLTTTEKAVGEKKVPTGPRANPLYKTRLCMNFQSTGVCPYTDKCQFAHGVQELEQWEQWRKKNGQKEEVKREGELQSNESRSRSQSMEKTSRTPSIEEYDFGSPQSTASLDFLSSPVMSSVNSVLDETPVSMRTEFSLWSAKWNDTEIERPFRPELRGRAATFDTTYDNMAQLSDAPTLFASPPILPGLGSRLPYQ